MRRGVQGAVSYWVFWGFLVQINLVSIFPSCSLRSCFLGSAKSVISHLFAFQLSKCRLLFSLICPNFVDLCLLKYIYLKVDLEEKQEKTKIDMHMFNYNFYLQEIIIFCVSFIQILITRAIITSAWNIFSFEDFGGKIIYSTVAISKKANPRTG